MNAKQHSSPTSGYSLKTILRSVFVVTLGASVFAAVSSQLRTGPVDTTIHFVTVPAATTETGSGMPAPSSTATEGNVVDLTYPGN